MVGKQAGVDVFAPEPGNGVGDPVDVARRAMVEAERTQHDIVVVDTAGRLGIDAELMAQAAAIRDAVDPDETLFVVDAMIGQDAVTTAQAFQDGVGFSGVVLTKLDGDARGGAALSVRYVTGQPIMFASTGEKLADFDVFHPERMASRILGMGDVLTLIEQAQRTFDEDEAERMAGKLASGNELHPGGLPRADAGDPADGPDLQPARDDAGDGPAQGPDQRHRRPRPRPDRGDHPRHDPGRAAGPEDHQRLPPGPDRRAAPAWPCPRSTAWSTGSSRPAR